ARVAVRELDAGGAFERSAILLVVPTGSGWVDPAGVGAAEYLYGGDIASVAVQYDDVPSWVAYLRGTRRARLTAAALLGAVRERVDRQPAAHRPKVLVFGESLGATAALTATRTAAELGQL